MKVLTLTLLLGLAGCWAGTPALGRSMLQAAAPTSETGGGLLSQGLPINGAPQGVKP